MSSHLSKFLKSELKRQKLRARAMAQRMGVHESQFSVILSGKQRSLETATLVKMSRGISDDTKIQTALIRAALADHNMALDPDFKSKAASLPKKSQIILDKIISGQLTDENIALLGAIIERLK